MRWCHLNVFSLFDCRIIYTSEHAKISQLFNEHEFLTGKKNKLFPLQHDVKTIWAKIKACHLSLFTFVSFLVCTTKNWFMLSVRISSYECTQEVWRVRKKRRGPFTQAIFVAATRCNFCLAKIGSSFKHVRNPCDIATTNRTKNRTWFTRAIFEVGL